MRTEIPAGNDPFAYRKQAVTQAQKLRGQGMIRDLCVALAAVLAAVTTPAAATKITYSGSGTVDSRGGSLVPTGVATVGSAFTFSLDFDTDDVKTFSVDENEGVYDVPVSAFAATIGGYDFEQSADPFFVPTLVLYRAFTFLGGTTSTPVLVAELYLTGSVQPEGNGAAPFAIPAGRYDTLVLSSIFVAADSDTSLALDQFRDPSLARQRVFSYQVNDPATRTFGRLSGSFVGGFGAAVPEPATWGMMVIGFMLLGRMLRSVPSRRERSSA